MIKAHGWVSIYVLGKSTEYQINIKLKFKRGKEKKNINIKENKL